MTTRPPEVAPEPRPKIQPPAPPDPRWQAARRILCVRLDSLGDVLMCTPAMRALRTALPGRALTLLGAPAGAAALPFIPELDDAIVWAAPWMKATAPQPPGAALALVEALAARTFDAAVIFTSYTQSALPAALLCHLAGIPLRLAHCRENPYGLLSDWVPDPEPARPVRHEVVRQLALVGHVGRDRGADGYGHGHGRGRADTGAGTGADTGTAGWHAGRGNAATGLSFALRPADVAAVRRLLRDGGIDADAPWLLLHPGASAASRRYPPDQWAQVLQLLARDVGLPMVLTGSDDEAALVAAIRAAAGVATVSLAGRLALGELGAALHLATVALTNNTGPAHIAAAVGTPVVDLYALTNPQHTPWNVRSRVLFHDVPCRFCFKSVCHAGHHACLAGVAPARVAAAVSSLLQPPGVDALTPDGSGGRKPIEAGNA
jgi:ADP-heptose:LPS heptosyltransferase